MAENKRKVRLITQEEVLRHLEMLNRAYSHWGSQQDWENKYIQPGFKTTENIIVVEENGEWVGGGTAWYRDAVIGKKRVRIYMPGDLFTLPEYSGKGVYSTSMRGLNKMAQENKAVLGITFPAVGGLPYRALPKYGFYDVFHPHTKIKLLRPEKLLPLLEQEKIGILSKFEGKHIRLITPDCQISFVVKDSALKRVDRETKPDITIKADFNTLFGLFVSYRGGRQKFLKSAVGAVLGGRLWVKTSMRNVLKLVFG